ncbi:hypothetical protein GOB42_15070 [Sinorhizobium meliloti]|nr:hypothetical protein [Sinorhizobium meliloti]
MDQGSDRDIISKPDQYLSDQGKNLEEMLDKIKLPPEVEEQIIKSKTQKVIKDQILGFFKVGEIVREVLNWNDSIDEEIREAKKAVLLSSYFDRTEQNAKALSELKRLLTSAQGNTLFNKILQILDGNPPDQKLAEHLSRALEHIINTDFVSLFEEHKYALAQIDQISAQALAILSDYRFWPTFRLGSYQSAGTKVVSDWLHEFATAYCRSKGVVDGGTAGRIQYSINELLSRRVIEAHLTADGNAVCRITAIGAMLIPYIVRR